MNNNTKHDWVANIDEINDYTIEQATELIYRITTHLQDLINSESGSKGNPGTEILKSVHDIVINQYEMWKIDLRNKHQEQS